MVNEDFVKPLDSDIFHEDLPRVEWSDRRSWGKTHLVRAETFDLFKDVKNIATDPRDLPSATGISIYCDSVTYSGPLAAGVLNLIDLAFPWKTLRYLHIYSRDFLASVNGLKAITLSGQYEVKISIVAVSLPPGLPVIPKGIENSPAEWPPYQRSNRCMRLALKNKGACREVELVLGEVGWRISIKPPGTVDMQPLQSVPRLELLEPTVAELYMYRDAAEKLKMLPKLLQLQLLAVSSEVFENRPTPQLLSRTMSRLQLLQRIEAPHRYPRLFSQKSIRTPLYAPLFKPDVCLVEVNRCLEQVKELDGQISDLSTQITLTDLLKKNFVTVVDALAQNEAGYVNVSGAGAAVMDAAQDLERKRADMETYTNNTRIEKQRFDEGLKKLAHEEEAQAITELWMTVGELAVGIVVTFASGGAAGAPAAAKVAADADQTIKKVSKVKKTLQTLLEVLKKLGEVAGDVGPKLMAAYQNQSTYKLLGKPTEASDRNEKNKEAGDSVLDLADSGPKEQTSLKSGWTDILGMEASWDEYRVNIGLMFDLVKELFAGKTIDGMQSYRQALETQVIRGKTVLAAMRKWQTSVQTFLALEGEKVAREKRRSELKATAERLGKADSERMRFRNEARLAYQRSLVAARRALFISIYDTALAHAYTKGTMDFPPNLVNPSLTDISSHVARADSSTPRFRQTIDALQKAETSRNEEERNLQMSNPRATVHTGMKNVFPAGWKELAIPSGRITFSVPPGETLEVDQQYYRIRTTGVWVHVFTGGKPILGIDYFMSVGPLMLTRNEGKEIASFYSATRSLRGQTGSKHFWKEQHGIIEPALFSEITIGFTPKKLVDAILSQSRQPSNSTMGSAGQTKQEPKTTLAVLENTGLLEQMKSAFAKIDKIQVDFEFEGIARGD
ncbi:hypothetical protein SVAN01_03461 [Stagonosporopsis vannaccii]|nr:hypothetical protein SVAN01_03461 [Stagonosporopsis vannaccii]